MRIRLLLVVVVAVLAIVVLRLARSGRHPLPAPLPTPARERAVAVALPSPTTAPISSSEVPVERHSTVVLPWESEPTPTPLEQEPTRRPGPSPTPEASECVAVTYSAGVLPGTLGRILVDIRAENRCGRDLGPLDVWFWVGGYRQGDLIQSVRGHPFDPIPQGGEGKAAIVLPGSIDWYDRIDVRVVAPGEP